MSVVRVAVPVLQGRRRFHFDKGRPWSVVEHLLLVSLAAKGATAHELAEASNLPHRLVIEAVIRLMRAGWVEMTQRSGVVAFQVTKEGLAAATSDELPNVARRQSRNMTFVVEQVTGGVFRSRELPFLHKYMVEERAAHEPIVWMDRSPKPIVDEINPLISALFQEDEKFVAIEPAGDRLNERWSLVTVRDGKVDGLTSRASEQLIAEILNAAKKVEAGNERTYQPTPPPPLPMEGIPEVRAVPFSAGDLVVGGEEHQQAISGTIRRARHRVIVHSTFIAEDRFDKLLDDFKVAVSHGATVDILWGQNEDIGGARSTRQVADRLRKRLADAGLERIRVHPFSTNSHSKILVADEGAMNRFVAFVGSCNWLYSGFKSFEVSVKLREPRLVSDVIDQLAELSRGTDGYWTELTTAFAGLAAHVRSLKTAPSGKARVRLLLGPQHPEVVRRARDEAETRIFVTSHRLGQSARAAVLAPAIAAAEHRGISAHVFYGETSGPVTDADAAEILRLSAEEGVTVRPIRKPKLHAKILAWDDDNLVITSQNWLSADPPDSSPRQEIGVHIHSPGIARGLIERFHTAQI